jgi:hypothetical protein
MSVARFFKPAMRPKILAGLQPDWLKRHPRRAYIEQVILATPPWVDHKAMLALHLEKIRRTEETGIEHVLDHIHPLKHSLICGLNVPWNLQIITRAQNAAKSNRFCPDQMDMFNDEAHESRPTRDSMAAVAGPDDAGSGSCESGAPGDDQRKTA